LRSKYVLTLWEERKLM